MNILFCSVGRRGELLKNIKDSLGDAVKIVATDASPIAPALYFADARYIVPMIKDPEYLDAIVSICIEEEIQAIFPLIDPEIAFLAKNRKRFHELGVEVLVPSEHSAELCFDKYESFLYFKRHGIPVVPTYGDIDSFASALERGEIAFPVFVKPRTGSGSVGARTITRMEDLVAAIKEDASLIVQSFMSGDDLDADVYIDTISKKVVAIFLKRKLSTTIGGANKTISFKDPHLFALIEEAVELMELNGPIDMDFFRCDGAYYLSEINPRFGGAYLHAYGAGVDFAKMIENNCNGVENPVQIGNYEEDIVMMMYDSVVIKHKSELAK